MPRTMQNIVILIEDQSYPWNISMKACNMCFNRFCVSENASFELSGVYFLKKRSHDDTAMFDELLAQYRMGYTKRIKLDNTIQGKGYSNK